jgi:hypothetical protein
VVSVVRPEVVHRVLVVLPVQAELPALAHLLPQVERPVPARLVRHELAVLLLQPYLPLAHQVQPDRQWCLASRR